MEIKKMTKDELEEQILKNCNNDSEARPRSIGAVASSIQAVALAILYFSKTIEVKSMRY